MIPQRPPCSSASVGTTPASASASDRVSYANFSSIATRVKRSAFHAITADRVIDPRAQRALYSPNASGAGQSTYRARAEAPRTAPRRADRGLREASRGERVAASEAGGADCRARRVAAEERAGPRTRRGDDRPTESDGASLMSDSIARVTIRILEKEYH